MQANGPATIPTVDISALVGSETGLDHVATQLRDACRINGCVGIIGHGISKDLLQHAFELSKNLYALSYEDKMKAPHPDALIPHRGYSGPGREAVAGSAAAKAEDHVVKSELDATTDYKETYEIGSEDNEVNHNIWLPDDVLPGFKTFTTMFYWKMFEFTRVVLQALVVGAGFDKKESQYAAGLHTGLDSSLRLLHYPPTKTSSPEGSRLGAHTDWGLFTLLFQDSVGGLEFQDIASGKFMPAVPQDGKIYLNIGDVLTRITNGLYPASVHRVTASLAQTPAQRESGNVPERYSIAYFVAPDPDAMIYVQPSRIIADGHMNYEPVVFETYSRRLFQASQKY